MNTKISALGLSLLVAMAASGSAYAQRFVGYQVQGRKVDVEVVSDQAGSLPFFYRSGRHYVPGEHNERYSIRLTNRTGQRVLAVVSVDGVNVISGQNASINQTGYVLDPWQTSSIEGWRKSRYDVARFYFTARNNSYASQTGRSGNEGIIGVAVFDEKRRYPTYPQPYPRGRNEDAVPISAPAASERTMSKSAPQLGTGHGEREYSYSQQTNFERQPRASEIITIEYDTWSNLQRRNVVPTSYRYDRYDRYGRDERNPFPNDGYVPDPPRRW